MSLRDRVEQWLHDHKTFTLRVSDDGEWFYVEKVAGMHGFWMSTRKLYMTDDEARKKYNGNLFSPFGSKMQPLNGERFYRCKICKAKWRRWDDGSWSLAPDEACGQCCDNVEMDEQIEQISGPPWFESYFRSCLSFTFWKVGASLQKREEVNGTDDRVKDYLLAHEQRGIR